MRLPTPSIYEEPTYPLQIHSKVNFQSLHRTSLGRNKGQAISNEHAVIKVRLVLVKDIHMYECEKQCLWLAYGRKIGLRSPTSTTSNVNLLMNLYIYILRKDILKTPRIYSNCSFRASNMYSNLWDIIGPNNFLSRLVRSPKGTCSNRKL